MFQVDSNSVRIGKYVAFGLVVSFALASPIAAYGKKKETAGPAAAPAPVKPNDFSKLVWPSPPDVVRIRYIDYLAGMKIDRTPEVATKKKKESWMDRMAGTPEGEEKQEKLLKDFPFQMIWPYGVGVDSKGLVYVADQKMGAVFVCNPDTKDVTLIENGRDAHFGWINGIALDDNDRLFVSDGKTGHVLVFNPQHQVEGQIKEGLVDPNGMAVDTENRLLYVVDTQQDQVLVYDADSYKLLRRIGTGGKAKHSLTAPGDFAAPTNVAVDSDGNVYVTDTLNDRIETFDADGNFISTFGKNCDAPGCFERPKGLAVDGDGHIWVADAVMDRLQIFNREGQIMMVVGSHGNLPSQFSDLVGVGYDKKNHRIFTTEQYPGRLQYFRYVTDEEAEAEKRKGEEERKQKALSSQGAAAAKQPPAGGQPPADKAAPAGPAAK